MEATVPEVGVGWTRLLKRSTEWARRGGGVVAGAEQGFGDSFRAFSDSKDEGWMDKERPMQRT